MAVWSLILPESGQQLVTADAMPQGSGLSHARMGSIQRAGSGAGGLDALGPVQPRTWRLHYELLSQAERGVLYGAWKDGGALWLIDPTQKNLLHPNVSTGGSAYRTTEGFAASGGTLARLAPLTEAPPVLGSHVISWQPSGAQWVDVGKSSPWDVYNVLQVPVEVGDQYTASIYLKRTSALAISIGFVDAADTPLGTQIWANGGGAPNVLTTAWQRFVRTVTASGTGPRLRLALENPNLTGGAAVVHAAAPQLEKGASATAWVPGQGPALVVITEFSESYSYPRAEYVDADVSFEEIGGPL